MTRPFKLTTEIAREHPIQKQIAKVLTMEIAPPGRVSRDGVVWFSIDVADYGGEVPGVRIGRGIIAGIPDLFLLHRGRAFVIEIKAEDGALSDPQQSVLAALFAGGNCIAVARDWIEVLACLDEWAIPRKRRVREATA